ncbi:MAG: hypothetical protein HQ498_02315 [Pseudohongiella sp.]|nr:hypothetical protein [Pseudohongiella sp.]
MKYIEIPGDTHINFGHKRMLNTHSFASSNLNFHSEVLREDWLKGGNQQRFQGKDLFKFMNPIKGLKQR